MNEGFEYRTRITTADAGRTVLAYLVLRFPHSDDGTWRTRIDAGEVDLDGRRAAASAVVAVGQEVTWRRPPWEEPAVPMAFAVLHLDDHLLAVAKPRGLPTMPAGGFLTHTLMHLVQRRWPEATPLHRLGRGTSGVLLFARSAAARRVLSAAWRGDGVEKEYRALVTGTPPPEPFWVATPIGPVPHPRLGRVHAAAVEGKRARSHVRVLEARGDRSVVAVRIATGRPHQIRIHMASCGHPLVGDPLYAVGGVPRPEPGLPGDEGYRLHAERLAFVHPARGGRVEILCPPPPELRVLGEGGVPRKEEMR